MTTMQPLLSHTTALSYQHILKPLLFRVDAETVHNRFTALGKWIGGTPAVATLLRWAWATNHPSLQKRLDGITFPNPVGLSAGFDYNADLVETTAAIGFGFHTIGTVTLGDYEGNPKPRLQRMPKSRALLVNKGLKNLGARAIIEKLKGRRFSHPFGISIASTNRHFNSEKEQIQDIVKCFRLFEKSRVRHAYYELNISCPNTFGGEPFTTPMKLRRLLREVNMLAIVRPIYVKMPIDLTRTETLALLKMISRSCAKGVIFGNLTKNKHNPHIHPDERTFWQDNKGNVSGQPTFALSTKWIRLTRKTFGDRFTIIGTGGIFTPEDAMVKLAAGADLVQLITGMIYQGPQVIGQITRQMI